MIKAKAEYRDVPFVPVLNGALGFFHRPSKSGLGVLKELGCTCVVSLLSPTENPHEIGNWCKEKNLKWHWVGLQGANKKLLEGNKTAWMIRKSLTQIHKSLIQGDWVLVHCAAGIHRTGTFSYALLRISGYSQEDTMETIRRIRVVTFERCGQFRFELAENIARQMMSEGVTQEICEFKGMNCCESVDKALVFVRFIPLDIGMIRFECIVTDLSVEKYVLGPFVNLDVEFKYLKQILGSEWLGNKEIRCLPGGIKKNFKKFEAELIHFFSESFPKDSGTWVGSSIQLDFHFISNFWPKCINYVSPNTIPLNSPIQDSIYQEVISYKLTNPN